MVLNINTNELDVISNIYMYWVHFCDNSLTVDTYYGTANMDIYVQGNEVPTVVDWSTDDHTTC